MKYAAGETQLKMFLILLEQQHFGYREVCQNAKTLTTVVLLL